MENMKEQVKNMVSGYIPSLVFLAMLALPWINLVHITTFVFIVLSLLLVLSGDILQSYAPFVRQLWIWGFALYYIFCLAAYFINREILDRAALEQKASLLLIPLLFYIIIRSYKGIWRTAIAGFICGNIIAALYCLVTALAAYLRSGDISVFFYHAYSHPIGMNAIYFSLYLLVSIVYLIKEGLEKYIPYSRIWWICGIAVFFLSGNLLLLDSKMMIAVAGVLGILFAYRSFRYAAQRLVVYSLFALFAVSLLAMNNPISKRYRDINFRSYSTALSGTDFQMFAFDGFNFRLLLWRMGTEIVHDGKAQLFGMGGEHYHHALNDRIRKYKLYTGDNRANDNGYLDYNMHNQYMESYVQFGLAGVLVLLLTLAYLFIFSLRDGNSLLQLLLVIFSILYITESGLETQSGILLFTIIISGEWIQQLHNRKHGPTA